MTKNIGIIGLGSIGMRHAKNLIAMGHSVYGYDPYHPRGVELINSGGHFSTFEEIVLAKYLAGIIIASPTKYHLPHMREVYSFDRAVLVEKPLADVPVPDEEFHLADMVGYNLRFHSAVLKAKTLLPQIGLPIWASFVCSQFNDKPAYLRDGVILNWSHEIDLALHLLGPAKVITSGTRKTDIYDDMTDILLEHENGCRTSIHLDYFGNPEQRWFTILGTNGSIEANLTSPRFAVLKRPGREPEATLCAGSFDDDYIKEMSAFIDIIDGKDNTGATEDDAKRVLEICLEVRKQAGLL